MRTRTRIYFDTYEHAMSVLGVLHESRRLHGRSQRCGIPKETFQSLCGRNPTVLPPPCPLIASVPHTFSSLSSFSHLTCASLPSSWNLLISSFLPSRLQYWRSKSEYQGDDVFHVFLANRMRCHSLTYNMCI